MVEATLDGIVQTVAAAVLVVILRLGHGVIDVDGGHLKLTVGQHLVKSMHTRGGLFCNAVDALEHFGVLLVQHRGQIATIVEHHIGVPGFAVFQDGLLDTPLVLFLSLAFPGKNRDACRGDGSGGVILS